MEPQSDALKRVVNFYQTLKPETLAKLTRVYASDASFKDPFNDVHGIDQIRHVLERMFKHMTEARFIIIEAVQQGDQAFLTWDMTFRLKRRPALTQKIHGASHLRFDDSGKVQRHRDYWDAGEEVYEKIPVFGSVVRWVRGKMG